MEFQQFVFERRSIRDYKPDPVPREVLDEIIEVAAQSPSSMNTQPWHVHVVTGDVLDRIRAGNTERMLATGKPDREIRGHGRYEGEHRERQKRVAAQLFEAAGIGWDDKAQRRDWTMRGFRQFDAPVSVIGCIDRAVEDMTESYFDLGQFVHAMVLRRRCRDQRSRNHAIVGGAGRGVDPRRSDDRNHRRHGVSVGRLRGERRRVRASLRCGDRDLPRLR